MNSEHGIGGDPDAEAFSVKDQEDIVWRLGFTIEEVKKDPYGFRSSVMDYLMARMPSKSSRIEHINDLTTDELAQFRQNVRGLLHVLTQY
jgi:hypothetical protein